MYTAYSVDLLDKLVVPEPDKEKNFICKYVSLYKPI